MSLSFAAVLFRPDQVSDRVLSHGFAVALAGWDLSAPFVEVAELRALPGWSAAFYRSGEKLSGHTFEELDHACELFEDELPPGLCVRDAAADPRAVVYAIVYSDEIVLDQAWRFSDGALDHRFIREGDDAIEAGRESLEDSSLEELSVPDDDEEAFEAIVRPHRGSVFLSTELGRPSIAALAGGLFDIDRRVRIRLLEADAKSIEAEAQRLNVVLRRTNGRGAFTPPSVADVTPPPEVSAFVRSYDWSDPTDAKDLYREVAIGAIEGTLHFCRPVDLTRLDADPIWKSAAASGLYPVATLSASSLGPSRAAARTIALAADRDQLSIVDASGKGGPAGPTFAELLRYLSLGFKKRDEIEEDLIGALQLRARLRAAGGD